MSTFTNSGGALGRRARPDNWRLASALALAMAAAGCGSWGEPPGAFEIEDDARQALERQGAKLEPRLYPQGPAWSVDLSGVQQITDTTFDNIGKIGYVTELNFSGTPLTDEQLAKVDKNLSTVVLKLDLSDTRVTDAGIKGLKHFQALQVLTLKGTSVTPEAVAQFNKSRSENSQIPLPYRKVKARL